jgi:hypothetical protein
VDFFGDGGTASDVGFTGSAVLAFAVAVDLGFAFAGAALLADDFADGLSADFADGFATAFFVGDLEDMEQKNLQRQGMDTPLPLWGLRVNRRAE